jgi:hypothetical protein
MIANALKRSDGNINYPGLIAAWSAKGKTNDDKDRATLKDLTGNGHDITLNGFAFNESGSGYGEYTTKLSVWNKGDSGTFNIISPYKINILSCHIINKAILYTSNSNQSTMKNKKQKYKVQGLTDGQSVILGSDTGSISILTITTDGEYEVDWTKNNSYASCIMCGFIGECNITIEVVPNYPDALVFDGVNDYGFCTNIPLLEDYTIIVKRKDCSGGCLFTKGVNTNGAFILEGYGFTSNTYNYGQGQNKNLLLNNTITWQNKNSYNQQNLIVGDKSDNTNRITIGALNSTDPRYLKGAFYSAYLFNRSLDEQEIKAFIRKYIDPEYLLPSEIPTPDCYYDFSKGSNDDVNRNTIKDYSGNGNDAVAHNFAWRGMSGYGGYNCYFSSNSGVDRYEGSFTNDKAHITKIIDEVNKNLINIYIINNFNIKISGITGNNLVRIGPPNVATLSLSNGTHKIDSSLFPEGYNYSIGILGDIGECDITIEFIPEYPGALVFDGVDDYISLDAFNSGFKTMFMLCANFTKGNNILYDQRSATFNKNFAIYNNTSIAYSASNINGTYINGILNTKLKCSELINKKHLIHVVTNDISESRKPNIGRSLGQNQYSIMALYKFLGFKEALTEEQIQTVIKKYNLLDGVDEIEVS